MARKKWTPKTDVDKHVLQLREKRKWQIAFRRYVLENNKSSFYAPFFGLPIEELRSWIEVQFEEDLSWENFSSLWQFEHVLPVSYFNFEDDHDLLLCWNFTNIRVEKLSKHKGAGTGADILAAKTYFEALLQQMNYWVCHEILQKIAAIETALPPKMQERKAFLAEHHELLTTNYTFSSADFDRLNTGMSLKSLLFEKDFMKKHGS